MNSSCIKTNERYPCQIDDEQKENPMANCIMYESCIYTACIKRTMHGPRYDISALIFVKYIKYKWFLSSSSPFSCSGSPHHGQLRYSQFSSYLFFLFLFLMLLHCVISLCFSFFLSPSHSLTLCLSFSLFWLSKLVNTFFFCSAFINVSSDQNKCVQFFAVEFMRQKHWIDAFYTCSLCFMQIQYCNTSKNASPCVWARVCVCWWQSAISLVSFVSYSFYSM